jgi:hypothetical protein
MMQRPIYEERQNVNYPFIGGIILFALAVGIIPGIIFGGLWWLTSLYTVFNIGALVGILAILGFQMKIELFQDKLVVKHGRIYHEDIDLAKVKNCSPYKMLHPMKTYGGWGIRKGKDGSFALTVPFIKEAIKVETPEQTFVVSSLNPEVLSGAIKSLL